MTAVRLLLGGGLVLLYCGALAATVHGQDASPAPPAAASEAEVSALRDRVAAFWAARVSGDTEGQWRLLEPRGRGRMTAQEYAAPPEGGRYLAYQVEGATVNGFFATVKVRVLVQQVLPLSAGAPSRPLSAQPVVVEDGWIRIGGVWYRRLDDGAQAPSRPRQP